MKPEDDIREKGERNDDNFIMLPTVDFCFKGLMNNPKVRKGFIAALLKKDPETIRETVLLPTVLGQEYQDDKLGILDVRVLMEDKTQIDMEMQVLELKKLPPDIRSGDDLIKWMKFFGGKSRKEFAAMAKTDSYIEEAYKELEKLSADERAKLEYEARERAIRDYNSQMSSALRRGEQKGEQAALKRVIENMIKKGKSREEIAELLDLELNEIAALTEEETNKNKLSG